MKKAQVKTLLEGKTSFVFMNDGGFIHNAFCIEVLETGILANFKHAFCCYDAIQKVIEYSSIVCILEIEGREVHIR